MKTIKVIIKFHDDKYHDITVETNRKEPVVEIVYIDSKLYVKFIEYNFERNNIAKYRRYQSKDDSGTTFIYYFPMDIVKQVTIKS